MANVIFEIVLIIILIVLTGILSMAELAVVSTKKAKLEKLDLSRKEYFGESYKNSIDSIMKAKAQVIKKENKKTEVIV